MKVQTVLLVVGLAIVGVNCLGEDVDHAIQLFVKEISEVDVRLTLWDYMNADDGMKKVVEFFSKEDNQKLMTDIENNDAFKDIVKKLEKAGLSFSKVWLPKFKTLFYKTTTATYTSKVSLHTGSGLKGLLKDFKTLIPTSTYFVLCPQVCFSPKFNQFTKVIYGADFITAVAILKISPEYKALTTAMKTAEIDIDDILDFVSQLPTCKCL